MAKHNEKGSLFLLAALAAVIVVLDPQVKLVVAGSDYTDAMRNCVKGVVENSQNIKNASGLVRLLFHDAFVRGLDGSVLLTSTPYNTPNYVVLNVNLTGPTEQGSPSNGGLRGLNVIDDIREACFKVNATYFNASCADGVAFAAHAATYSLSNGKINYAINGPGHQDGVVSKSDEPGNNLPGPTFNYTQLKKSFEVKGFTTAAEIVALSGAHSIGVAHLTSFATRETAPPNQMNTTYRLAIFAEAEKLPTPEFKNNIRDMKIIQDKVVGYNSTGVNMTAVGVLDNSYYTANLQNMVLFNSDWALRTDTTAADLLIKYRDELDTWIKDFSAAMTKLSNDLPAKAPFEIGSRKKCSAANFDNQKDYDTTPKP